MALTSWNSATRVWEKRSVVQRLRVGGVSVKRRSICSKVRDHNRDTILILTIILVDGGV